VWRVSASDGWSGRPAGSGPAERRTAAAVGDGGRCTWPKGQSRGSSPSWGSSITADESKVVTASASLPAERGDPLLDPLQQVLVEVVLEAVPRPDGQLRVALAGIR
jgi:hypothetical protein